MLKPPHGSAAVATAALAILLGFGCDSAPTPPLLPDDLSDARAGYDEPGMHRQYGTPVKVGDGMIRAYVVLDARAAVPMEVGIAMDARALEGLSATDPSMLVVPLPAHAPAPYEFALVDWNPGGHEPPGVYDVPHFDYHFYTVPWAEVEAIVPADPDFAAEANNLPSGAYVPPHYVVLAPPGLTPADVAVPRMGVHWVDVRSPELQGIFGNPGGYEPFTATFIYGSWDGRLTFWEPMVTTEHLLTLPDEVRPISQPTAFPEPGWYPGAYRIQWDPQSREYRVALTQLSWQD